MTLPAYRPTKSVTYPPDRTHTPPPDAPPAALRLRPAAATDRAARFALSAIVTIAWLVFGWALVAQHRAYNSRAYDLGYFDQVIWNTAHGRWFETNFVEFNFLGEHFQPVLLLFAGLYRVSPSVETVLVIQSAFVAGAAVPLYIVARRTLASAGAALMVAAAYLLTPQVHWAALFDFHPEMLGAAAIFAAFALLTARRPACSIIVLCTLSVLKEDAALAGIGFAWLLVLGGYRRHAILLFALSLLYGVLVMGWLMPALRGNGDPGLFLRYGYLGDSPVDVLAGIVTHPVLVWQHLIGADQRQALGLLLAGAAALPLAGPAVLMLLPVLVPDLLSTHDAQRALDLHYGFYPATLTLVAAVIGAARLADAPRLEGIWRRLRVPARRRTALLAAALLLAEATAALLNSPLGLRFDPTTYRRTPHTAAIDRMLARIPADAPLSAQSNLVPHLSQREFIRDFPRIDHARYVVVDLKTWGIWQTSFETYREILWSLPSIGFCRIAEDDGVELYERRTECPSQ